MSFKNGHLKIELHSGQIRIYSCDAVLAYGLFYCKNAADEMSYYSTKIKKLCNVADVIEAK